MMRSEMNLHHVSRVRGSRVHRRFARERQIGPRPSTAAGRLPIPEIQANRFSLMVRRVRGRLTVSAEGGISKCA
jgi:hypothetical protein